LYNKNGYDIPKKVEEIWLTISFYNDVILMIKLEKN